MREWWKKGRASIARYVGVFFPQRYGLFSLALAFIIIDPHSFLFNAFVLRCFTPSFLKSYPYFICMVVFLNLSGIL